MNDMASRRVPLASNPQAVNSPRRAAALATKRTRDILGENRLDQEDQPPSKKRHLLDASQHTLQRSRPLTINRADASIFETKPSTSNANTFQKRLVASRGTRSQEPEKEFKKSKTSADEEQIRVWQKHYRKVFPQFVFYLESVPDEKRSSLVRTISYLGAREEKFFSRKVTHIITTRAIPPDASGKDSSSGMRSSSSRQAAPQPQPNQAKTINPSLLDKQFADAQSKVSQQQRARAVEAMLAQTRPPGGITAQDARRQQQQYPEILLKARELEMKIWPLEKFERMLETLLDLDADEHAATVLRKGTAGMPQPADADLQQMLRDEKTKQGQQLPWSDIIQFRGCFIYIHDVEEKYRPVMVREYAKPRDNEEGDWPQLHSVQMPRCPFVGPEPSSKQDETERESQVPAAAQNMVYQQRTRAATAAVDASNARTAIAATKGHPVPVEQVSRQIPIKDTESLPPQARMFEAPALTRVLSNTTTDSLPPHLTNRFHFQGIPRPGVSREPLASGLQKSNQTSAIRSQVVSSTAANPVARIGGKSKEMHELQRRAVEQRRTGTSVNSVPSSFMNDVRAAINNDSNSMAARGSRRQPPQTLMKIHEDENQTDEEQSSSQQQQQTRRPRPPMKRSHSSRTAKAKVQREPKPGYCENCREKYDDFNEHIVSRKHRKFATAAENWGDLDALLRKLKRE